MTISVVIIAKNEEEVLERCLKSVSFCDEILVVDNNSSDKTREIAKNYNAIIIEKDTSDFSELRNVGKKEASGDFVFYVDADEVATEELKKSILYETKTNSSTVGYQVRRKNFYLGKNEWPKIEEILRLFKREKLLGWKGEIHESAVVDGPVGTLDGFLLHYTHRDLSQMLDKTIEWSDIESKIRIEAKHPKMTWWRFPRVMITTFFNYYFLQRGYKLGVVGLIESTYQSFSTFITYAKLWEKQNKFN